MVSTFKVGGIVTLKSEPNIKLTVTGLQELPNIGPSGTKAPIGVECAWSSNGLFYKIDFPELALNKAA